MFRQLTYPEKYVVARAKRQGQSEIEERRFFSSSPVESGVMGCLIKRFTIPIGSMYGIYANIWGILMVNVTIYGIHGSYGI